MREFVLAVPWWVWIEGYPRAFFSRWIQKIGEWQGCGVWRWGRSEGWLASMWTQHLETEVASLWLPTLPFFQFLLLTGLQDPLKREVCQVILCLIASRDFDYILGPRQTSRAWASPASGPLCLPRCGHADLMGTPRSGSLHWLGTSSTTWTSSCPSFLVNLNHPSDRGSILISLGIVRDLRCHSMLWLELYSHFHDYLLSIYLPC